MGFWGGVLSHVSLRDLFILAGEMPPTLTLVPSDLISKPLSSGPFVGLGHWAQGVPLALDAQSLPGSVSELLGGGAEVGVGGAAGAQAVEGPAC